MNVVNVSMLAVGVLGFLTLGWLDAIRSTIRRLSGSYVGAPSATIRPGSGFDAPAPGRGGGGGGGRGW